MTSASASVTRQPNHITEASSFWPHALDAIALAGKRRRKQYFPEAVPGLFGLSKTEIIDDIDNIEYEIGRHSSRDGVYHRRRPYRTQRTDTSTRSSSSAEKDLSTQSAEKTSEECSRPSKRARLITKITENISELGGQKIQVTDMREALDALRGEVAQIYDTKARLERQAKLAQLEKQNIEHQSKLRQEELTRSLQELESIKQMNENRIKAAIGNIEKTTQETDFIQACAQRVAQQDERVRELELELGVVRRQLLLQPSKADQSISPTTASIASSSAVTASYSSVALHSNTANTPTLAATPIIPITGISSTEALELNKVVSLIAECESTKRESEDQARALTLARKQFALLLEAQQKVVEESRAKDKQVENDAARIKNLEEQNTRMTLMGKRLALDVSLAAQRLKSHNLLVEASDQRAVEAERVLLEHTRNAAVLKAGNNMLQAKFNDLLRVHTAALESKAEIAEQLERATARTDDLETAVAAISCEAVNIKSDKDPAKKLRVQIEVIKLKLEQLVDGGNMDVNEKQALLETSISSETANRTAGVNDSVDVSMPLSTSADHDDQRAHAKSNRKLSSTPSIREGQPRRRSTRTL